MTNEWIIDVLNDLKAFAQRNGMDATAAQLDDACLVAHGELSDMSGGPAGTAGTAGTVRTAQDHEAGTGNITHLIARRDTA